MIYTTTSLKKIYSNIGEKTTIEKLKKFKCDLNPDIENFIKNKAIEFSKKSIAETFIVTTKFKNKDIIVGYFTLTYKIIKVQEHTFKGKTKKRMLRFAQSSEDSNYYLIPLPLIGQVGKNYFENYNKLISGEELLYLAFEKIKQVQNIVGGRFTFIECCDTKKLKMFYEKNGFRQFSKKELEKSKEYLIQMLIDLSNY